jgi:Nitrous oxide-stimulated promoter
LPSAEHDIRVLDAFIRVYCQAHHQPQAELCDDCLELRAYARERLAHCPLDPKPKCKNCPVHCYAPEYRARIREVMKFSGMHFVKRGRIDWLWRYFR